MRMVATLALASVLASGCSFVLVKDTPRPKPGVDTTTVPCTDSAIVPGIDAFVGAAGVATAAGGVLLQQTSSDGHPAHFTTYYAGPILLASILYFYAASGGTDRVSQCKKLHERAEEPAQIRPIDMGPAKPKPAGDDIQLGP